MYLLDTNICIYLIKKNYPCLQERIEKEEISSLSVSAITIGPYDLQIASQCLSRNYCLVTNNVKEFKRVPELKIENWIK